jgi:hypothetical protein
MPDYKRLALATEGWFFAVCTFTAGCWGDQMTLDGPTDSIGFELRVIGSIQTRRVALRPQ